MKKLLMIAYDFPPSAAVGIYRSLKFAKYLPALGWEPTVLTVSNGKYAKYDETTFELVPQGTRVHRAPSLELFNVGESRGRHGKPPRRTFMRRVLNRLSRAWSYLMIPDEKATWVPAATLQALRIVDRERIRHVYVTGKPFSAFWIGYFMKRLRGVQLTIDYRDPWTQNINYLRRSAFHTRLERWQEQLIVRAADIVVANTRHNEEAMVRDFGAGQARGKFITIHNGYDAEDFAAVPSGKFEEFTITYAGAFYYSIGSRWDRSAGDDVMRTYSPLVFFEALKRLVTARPDVVGRLRVNFMGVLAEGYDSVIREMGLESIVHRLGYLDYNEHLTVLKRSHATLLVLSSGEKSRGWIPSKLFSYLGAGTAVLALAPEGEVRDIIRASRAGLSVDPDDVEGTVEALITLYDHYNSGRPFERDEPQVAKFERRALTELLARALERTG